MGRLLRALSAVALTITSVAAPAYFRREARRAARRYGLDPRVFTRQIRQESGFNPGVVSPAGAIGIAQIMPATAKGWGVNPHDPVASLDAAAKNMAGYVRKFGSYRNALIAYNAGPGAVGRANLPAETRNYIATILGGSEPGGLRRASSPGRASGAPEVNGMGSFAGAGNQPQGSEGILSLLTALAEPKQTPVSSGLQAPSFAAGPQLAGQVPQSSGGPAPKQETSALLDAIRTAGGDIAHAPGMDGITLPGGGAAGGQGAGGGGGPSGKVVVDPGANRAGVPLQPGPLRFARKIAGLVGEPVHISTGTAHNRTTVSGNVSDHWRGEGMDIPATGNRLVQLGQAALIAAGMPAAQARKAKGGAYRVGGKQIIFASNLPGYGDHTTHLHVGLSRRRG